MSPLQGGTTVFGFAWDTGFLPPLSFFFVFGCTMQLVGSYFLDWGLNPHPRQ